MAMDVGNAATNRGSSQTGDYTLIILGNPANESSYVRHVEIYATGDMTCQVGAFFLISGSDYGCTYYSGNLVCASGLNTFDAPGDFTEFAIASGEFIGISSASLALSYDTSGSGLYHGGDYIPYANVTMLSIGRAYSVYATSEAAATGASIPVLMNLQRRFRN